MKNLTFLFTVLLFSIKVQSQVFEIRQFAHTSYMNPNPGQIVVSNNNWQDNIEYIGSGWGYDVTYIYDFNKNEVEVIERDSLGNVIEEEGLITSFNVIFSDDKSFYVFNPTVEKFSMFYFDDYGVPHLLVENLKGRGFFVSGKDMNLKITEN